MKEGGEAIVVLHGPGSESRDTQARLEHGLYLYDQTGVDLVLSGGWSQEVVDIAENEMSPRHDGRLEVENLSADTIGNALWTWTDAILSENYRRMQLVTAGYHINRARWTFEEITKGIRIDNEPAKTAHSEQELARLARKERIMLGVTALMLFDYSTDPEAVARTKRRVQTVFWKRYH